MLTSLIAALVPLTLAPQAALPQPTAFALRAAQVHLPDGSSIQDGIVLVDGGRIREVGRGVRIPSGMPLIEHAGSISAGLVACHSYDGLQGRGTDTTRALLPELRVADSFHPSHKDFERALAAGVTSVVLVPGPGNLIGGLCAVVRTHGGTLLERESHLSLALDGSALMRTRVPTSYAGALEQLEQLFAEREGSVGRALSGKLPVMIEVDERHEIARALDFAAKHGLRGALSGGPLAGELAQRIHASGLSVVLPPFELGTEERALRTPAQLAEAGVPFAFGMDAPGSAPAGLRLSAALSVQHGLDPQTALRALTSEAARIAGVEERVGRVESGRDADLVLWSGHPLELSSSVQAVYVAGVLAWSAKPAPKPVTASSSSAAEPVTASDSKAAEPVTASDSTAAEGTR
jgi:imidazolonepropionase-like amidohydrolase